MITLIAAALVAAQAPAAPAGAVPMAQHEQHQNAHQGQPAEQHQNAHQGQPAEHKRMECCKDCCKDMSATHKDHESGHSPHRGR